MDTPTSVAGTVGVVALGLWANDKKIDMKFVVGSGIYAMIIALLGQSNDKLGRQFATLVFVTALLVYIVDIVKALGFTGSLKAAPPASRRRLEGGS